MAGASDRKEGLMNLGIKRKDPPCDLEPMVAVHGDFVQSVGGGPMSAKKSSKKATFKNPPPSRSLPRNPPGGGTEKNPDPNTTLPNNPPRSPTKEPIDA